MKTIHRLALASLCGLGWASAQAQWRSEPPSPLYGQVGLGAAHANLRCPQQAECGRSGSLWRAALGWRLGGGWALELGGLAVGNFDHKALAGDSHRDIEGDALLVGAAHQVELTRELAIAYRLGLASVRTRSGSGLVANGRERSSGREPYPYVGLNLGYRFNRTLSLQLGVDSTLAKVRYADQGGETVRLTGVMLGLGFGF